MNVKILTPKLPIALVKNTTLFFEKAEAGWVEDPDTGNLVPNTEIIEIDAHLRNQRTKTREAEEPGLNVKYKRYMGFIMSAPAILETLDYSQQVRALIEDPVTGSSIDGLMQLEVTPTPYSVSMQKVANVPIRGILQMTGSGENG